MTGKYSSLSTQIDQWTEQSQNLMKAFQESTSASENTELTSAIQERQQHLEQDIAQMRQFQEELTSIS